MTSTKDALGGESDSMWFSMTTSGILLGAHTNRAPEPATWSKMLDAIRALHAAPARLRVAVFTDGGVPNGDQRKALGEVVRRTSQRIAVTSASASVRFVTATMSLVLGDIKSFAPQDWRSGIDYLELSSEERFATESTLRQLAVSPYGSRFETLQRVFPPRSSRPT